MDYITVQEASEAWGISTRQVQKLCEKNRVPGAIRFNRSWGIPSKAEKPLDGRSKVGKSKSKSKNVKVWEKSKQLNEASAIFKQIVDKFPYSVNISNSDGVMVYANDAFMEGVIDEVREASIGTYNIKEEKFQEKWGLREHIEKAFKGEYVVTSHLKHPNQDLIGTKYSKDYSFITMYNDLISFTIFDDKNNLAYVVTIIALVNKYQGRDEVNQGREYIENNWKEPFDIKQIAKVACLSTSRFMTVFKEAVGFSVHEYYLDLKISHLKENLLDLSMSVSEAFNECGIDYNSYYTSIFKKYTGLSPIEFRKNKQ